MEKIVIESPAEFFGPLYELIMNDEITDVDFNGSGLWITDCANDRRMHEVSLEEGFLDAFSKRVANLVSKPFNKQYPVLEAQTDTLRITIVHESIAITGRCICIRKSLPYVRLTREKMILSGYASEKIVDYLQEQVREKKNIVFCGEPGVGKTECAKFFSSYIPDNERVITIEDTPEWHYSSIHPGADCVELRLSERMDYTGAIKTCLRLNPKWMMLSETRSREVTYLIEGFSTGVKGFTTLHTDDVRKIPDRMLNMAKDNGNTKRLENDIYSFIDIGVLIRRKQVKDAQGGMSVKRIIDQICLFKRENGKNIVQMLVEDGQWIDSDERIHEYEKI